MPQFPADRVRAQFSVANTSRIGSLPGLAPGAPRPRCLQSRANPIVPDAQSSLMLTIEGQREGARWSSVWCGPAGEVEAVSRLSLSLIFSPRQVPPKRPRPRTMAVTRISRRRNSPGSSPPFFSVSSLIGFTLASPWRESDTPARPDLIPAGRCVATNGRCVATFLDEVWPRGFSRTENPRAAPLRAERPPDWPYRRTPPFGGGTEFRYRPRRVRI